MTVSVEEAGFYHCPEPARDTDPIILRIHRTNDDSTTDVPVPPGRTLEQVITYAAGVVASDEGPIEVTVLKRSKAGPYIVEWFGKSR